ncbi:MAG TPA: SPOR domain-containing protein [Noviherbaspirillum sp.]|nr:SPOR domain-containing protein [Noviherbaspirillum sp.]
MKQNRQRGGTLLGIVIGLLLGLGIALAVAMVVTKTPIPFTDKSGRQKAAEPTARQSADPNQPMYRRRGAAPETAEVAPPVNTAAPLPAAQQEVRVAPAQPIEPGQAVIIEQSATERAAAQEEKWQYYLQAGAFREMHDAESMRAKLALLGVEARVTERHADTGLLFRVRAGPFDQLEAMNRVRTKLTDNGIDAAVVRISR